MRTWTPCPADPSADHALVGLIGQLGLPGFQRTLLHTLAPVIPAASFSVYSVYGMASVAPQLFMSASHGIADTTVACWQAYLAGPHQSDQTLSTREPTDTQPTRLMHITAQEVPPAHRAQVYDAHGMAERVSVVQSRTSLGGVLALNFYRHQHQRAFQDDQLAALSSLAPALMALVQKQLALTATAPPATPPLSTARQRLQALNPQLTPRELDVCARLLLGMTQDGIASDLGIGLPTVKTLRNRAFARLGIHFRNELFARVMPH